MVATVAAAGAAFRGIHFYEGHLAECCAAAGASAVEAAAAVVARGARCAEAYETLADVVVAVNLSRGSGAHVVVQEVVTSGTPGFTAALAFDLKAAVDARLDARTAGGTHAHVAHNPWCARCTHHPLCSYHPPLLFYSHCHEGHPSYTHRPATQPSDPPQTRRPV